MLVTYFVNFSYLGKSCSFGLPRVSFVNCRQFMYLVISLLVLRASRMWDLIVSVPDHCLSFCFRTQTHDPLSHHRQHAIDSVFTIYIINDLIH